MNTKEGLYNTRFIEGEITLKFSADVPDGSVEISELDAIHLLQRELDYLASSNDGSELLANATIKLIK